MSSATRRLLLAFYAIALAALFLVGTPLAVLPAAASPLPLPLVTYFAREYPSDYSLNAKPRTTPVKYAFSSASESDVFSANETSVDRRDINTTLGNINILNNYWTQMTQHADNFRSLSARRPSRNEDITEFSQQSSTEVTGFQDNLSGFSGILGELAADKGLANYNENDALEILLKKTVNANKDLLKSIDEGVYQIPGLGSTLGPIVYEIKCILDEILDAVENLSDAVLNDLQLASLYRGLIADASKTACNSGLQIIGLCILL
ncbi:unnamed protein product [Somion occarium]|uniref:Uncharacterized protein n=1 Tax=Somion occarium TaxID=3059160 RepID=A0ABP1CJI2_9APHY